jgi:PAS domain S-box-containing protein
VADETLDKLGDLIQRGFVSDLGTLAEFLLDLIPESILIANRLGNIVLMNAAFERLTGYQRKNLLGLSVETLVPAPKRIFHKEVRERYLQDPKPRMMALGSNIHVLLPDGTEVAILAELIPAGEYIVVKVRKANG